MDTNKLPRPEDFRHTMEVQLRFNDIDILGHMNNTRYFSLYDTGKARYFETVHGVEDWRKVEAVIANINCTYVAPIFFGEKISVGTRCLWLGEKSFCLQQILFDDKGEVRSVCETVMVSFDPEKKHSVVLPDHWRDAFTGYETSEISSR